MVTPYASAGLAAAAFITLLVGSGGAAFAGADPAHRWFTITSEHFAVHSYDDGEAIARDVVAYCEEAWRTLNPVLGWTPTERVHVVVADHFDSANGFASVLPFDAMTIWAYPPSGDNELGDYANWLKLLVFHEYAHILHLDNATGVPGVFNLLLGKSWQPNEALPRWTTEGIATWVESRWTGGGRVGSSRFEMFLRAAALESALPDLGELTGAPLVLPRSSAWYMYGGYLFDYIARHAGPDAIKRFAASYGRRLIPYSINTTARRTTGKTLTGWHAELLKEVGDRAAETLRRVDTAGRVEGRRLTDGGEFKAFAKFSPDGGHLAWVWGDGHRPQRLVMAPLAELDDPQTVIRCEGGCGAFTFSRDGTEIIYGTSRFHRQVHFFGALNRIPATPGLGRRTGVILKGAHRAQNPAISADGKRVWFVSNAWGQTRLEAVDIATGDVVDRWSPPKDARIDAAVETVDGAALLLGMHHAGNRDLYRLELQGQRRLTRLTEGRANELDVHLSADGRYLLYSSDATGVYNIYARQLATGVVRQLTNVVTGAFDPAVSPDGGTLVYSGWTAAGFELYALPFTPQSAPAVAVADPMPLQPAEQAVPTATRQHDYQPLPTMLPRSWFPTYVADSSGVSRLGLELGGVDLTNRFAVTLGGEYDFLRDEFNAFALLGLRTSWPDISLSLGRFTSDRTSFVGDLSEPYLEEVYFTTLSVSLPLPTVFTGMSVGAGYTVDVSRGQEVGRLAHTPDEFTAFVPAEGLSTSFNLFASVGDVESFTFGVSPGLGFGANMSFRLRDPAIGSRRSNYSLTYAARAFIPNPLLDDHVLALRLGGGFSGGDPATVGVFALGGVPSQDILVDLLNERQGGSVWLRGFEPASIFGTSFQLLTAEYRFPLFRLRHGLDTLPIFAEDVSVAIFTDVGSAWSQPLGHDFADHLYGGAGIELRWGMNLFYGFAASFRLGYARGFGESGIDQVYILMAPIP